MQSLSLRTFGVGRLLVLFLRLLIVSLSALGVSALFASLLRSMAREIGARSTSEARTWPSLGVGRGAWDEFFEHIGSTWPMLLRGLLDSLIEQAESTPRSLRLDASGICADTSHGCRDLRTSLLRLSGLVLLVSLFLSLGRATAVLKVGAAHALSFGPETGEHVLQDTVSSRLPASLCWVERIELVLDLAEQP